MITVRKAELKDIAAIKKIATMAWHDTYLNIMAASTITQFLTAAYSDEMLEKRVASSLFLVAEDEQQVVGFSNFINGRELYLAAIYVMPGFQRRNVGGQLLEEGLQYFDDYDELYVEVASDNEAARSFYDKQGFILVREYEEDLFGEQVMTGLLKKTLK